MMAADRTVSHLIEHMPVVRGRIRADEPLARYTWFRVGGPAEVLFEPVDLDDLRTFLAACPAEIDITMIGGTSNILIRDGGIPGVVIRLGKAFAGIEIEGNHIHAGAAAADMNVARRAAEAGLAGLEFLIGIPGTVGGALRMNAGAYGAEIGDVLESATAVDRQGNMHTLHADEMGFSYRTVAVPADLIFTSAVFSAVPGDAGAIQALIKDIQVKREATQPVREKTGGSTFANPWGHKAWELIDAAGCRGLRIGGAQVSEAHCNFLINAADATASDLEQLGEEVRRRVMETSGVDLHWEIRRLGVAVKSAIKERRS